MTYVKKSIVAAICIALCVVLPLVFHSIQNAGNIFCPMHIPVLLSGLLLGGPFGLLCGLAGPILSSLITGMPSLAYLPSMMVELAAYGAITGLMMQLIRTKKIYVDLYVSLIIALIVGRIIAGVTRALIFFPGSYSMAAWTTSYFVTCLPGIAIQFILIPAIVLALEKARLIPMRYPNQS